MKIRPQSLKGLILGLFRDGQGEATLAKAKRIQPMAERLVTYAREKSLSARRQILATLGEKKLTHKLMEEVVPTLGPRQSGFTRIVRLGRRKGDGAMMARIEFVEPFLGKAPKDKGKQTRKKPVKEEGKDEN